MTKAKKAKPAPAKKAKPAPKKAAKPAPKKAAKPAPKKAAKPAPKKPAKPAPKKIVKPAAPAKKAAPASTKAAAVPSKKAVIAKKVATPVKPLPPQPKQEKSASTKKMEEKVTRNPVVASKQTKQTKAEDKPSRAFAGASSAPKVTPIKVEIKPVHIEEPKLTPRVVGEDLFSDEELETFRGLLETERTKLLAKAKRLVEEGNIQIDKNEMMDEVDQASAMAEQNLTFRLLDRDRKLLDEIEHALAKIDTGDYGYCEGTGDPIPKRRLELRPWCRHSVKYKEKLERMKKSGRGVVDEDEV